MYVISAEFRYNREGVPLFKVIKSTQMPEGLFEIHYRSESVNWEMVSTGRLLTRDDIFIILKDLGLMESTTKFVMWADKIEGRIRERSFMQILNTSDKDADTLKRQAKWN